MKPRSLRRDLSLGIGLGLTLLWLLAMTGTTLVVREELDEVYDSLMEETAHRLLPMALQQTRQPPPAKSEVLLTWVLRDIHGTIILRSGGASDAMFDMTPEDGFSTIGDFRHFTRSLNRYSLDVASPLQERREAARGILLALLVPALILLPLCLIGVAWFTRRNFRSVDTLSAEVSDRAPSDLQPLITKGLQTELLPIRDAVNRLMQTLDTAITAERAFSANAAHELRTPIAAILAHVQRLLAEAPDGPVHDRASIVEVELKRTTRLVEKLIQLARAESISSLGAEAVDATRILRMIANDYRAPLQVPDDAVMVHMDADTLAILARNLIENAVVHGRNVEVNLSRDGWLRVVNEGPVISPQILPNLTERFERAYSRKEGSGLGLAIVSAITRSNSLLLNLYSPANGRADGFEAGVRLPLSKTNVDVTSCKVPDS
ncbi:histidine kinase dimerization/phospho-acceptor domain-containing protein [Paracoccus sp. JM45]|uniref:histidine kinase dimerization/phospho-acceptor domain-containing protein n=1 Tax=Paracoccus sp. JM45 TaxID=2283626 RepID=UPI000E6D16FA|nr:histidine kinase dimerization/phospho-acceptor domain-containing protein [Paracoccus sp. JM45]RJE78488.1 two-component sensor histidine kinase [Paracoccus sp. JM45]